MNQEAELEERQDKILKIMQEYYAKRITFQDCCVDLHILFKSEKALSEKRGYWEGYGVGRKDEELMNIARQIGKNDSERAGAEIEELENCMRPSDHYVYNAEMLEAIKKKLKSLRG